MYLFFNDSLFYDIIYYIGGYMISVLDECINVNSKRKELFIMKN